MCFRSDLEKLRRAIDEGRKSAVTKKNKALITANESLNKFSSELNKKIAQVSLSLVYTSTLLHSERPKLYAILAFLSAVGLIYHKIRSTGLEMDEKQCRP